MPLGTIDQEWQPAKFAAGQQVWVDGRPATFVYSMPPSAAVVRYQGAKGTHVVVALKITPAPRPASAP